MSHKTITRYAKDDDGVIIKVQEMWALARDADISPYVNKETVVDGSTAEDGHSWVLDTEQKLPDGFTFDVTLTDADYQASLAAATVQADQDASDAESAGLAVEASRRDLVNKIAAATGLDAGETTELFELLGVSES